MYTTEQVRELAIQSGVVTSPIVKLLAEGFGNYNYALAEGGGQYVFRIKKSSEEQFMDSLEREYVFLSYFKHHGIDFCPEALHYNAEHNFLIESFLPGKLVSQADFTPAQIDTFARQLHELFSIDVHGFAPFCVANSLKIFSPTDPVTSLDQYGHKRFSEVDEAVVGSEVVRWIDTQLAINTEYVASLPTNIERFGFCWGDIQSEVLVRKNNMYFFDFEHVTVSYSAGLAYIMIHGQFDSAQQEQLMRRYAAHSNTNQAEVRDEIKRSENVIRVNDVIWAAMMWSKQPSSHFKQKTYERMALVTDG